MHKSPLTSGLHFSVRAITIVASQTRNSLPFSQMSVYSRAGSQSVCVSVCVWVHVLWRPQSLQTVGVKRPQTAHTETHRLQSAIHLSHHPYLCFLSRLPPPCRAPSGGHRLQSLSCSLHPPFIHPSLLLAHMTSLTPIVHLSLSGAPHLHLLLN